MAGEPRGSPVFGFEAGLLIPPPCPLTLLNVVTERACNSGGRIMTKQTTLTSPDSPTREQLVRRVAFLERVTLTASMNADRFSKHAERIAALARAIKSAELSLVDRITLVEAVEFLAATAETDAALDKECIRYACTCAPDEWDQFDPGILEEAAAATKH